MTAKLAWRPPLYAILAVLCVALSTSGAAKAMTVTYNGEAVYDIFDEDYIPIQAGPNGTISRIYRNMTSEMITELRLVFMPGLRQTPDVRGADVLRADVDEVIYRNLTIGIEKMFRLRMFDLAPNSRLAFSTDAAAPLSAEGFDQLFAPPAPNPGAPVAAPIPLPIPLVLLGTALAILVGLRRRAHAV